MKAFAALAILLFSAPCYGDQIIRFKDGSLGVVSEAPKSDFKYPPEVYSMTAEEFARWATEQNQIARDNAYREYVHGNEDITAEVTRTDVTGNLGASHHGVINRGRSSVVTRSYQHTYRNPQARGPEPLLIINPFCPPKK
ncbi:MAG: hypothetical protein AMXMBFR16_10520 [Candidatus Uhrbacteria bacterium]